MTILEVKFERSIPLWFHRIIQSYKLRRRLFAVKADIKVSIGDAISFNNKEVGKILIDKPFPFALIKLYDPDILSFKSKEIYIRNKKVQIINHYLSS